MPTRKNEIEFLPGTPVPQGHIDWVEWLQDYTWRWMIEVCRIPEELFSFDGKTQEAKAKNS